MAKKAKKLSKEIVGNVVKITEVVTGKAMEFDFTKLPKEIQAKFGPFGLGHKLGDAAAGDSGQDAVDSITKTWDGLMAGNWAVRVAKGESVSVSAIASGIEKLPPKEAEAAKALLIKLGILKVPAAK
jgi:phage FluMu gp28-like protein